MAAEPLVPRNLAIPEPGSATARALLSRAMSRLLRELTAAPHQAPASVRAEAAVLHHLVRAALVSAPGPLASVLRRPTVGGLLRCLRDEARPDREALFLEFVAQLAFELALVRALPGPVRLTRVPARLLSIPARLALGIGPGTRALVFERGALTVEHDGGATRIDLDRPASAGTVLVESPYHELSGDIVLALADNNPIALVEAHPDKSGNAIDLGDHGVREWVSSLSAAFDLVARHLPEIRGEIDLFLSQVVPVGWDPVKHLSASYREVLGTVYLTLHPSRMTLSEALIHEFSHHKLNALFELDEVLENAWSPLYTSPVRPDPRPLHGVLLAVHAFLPVARLYERMMAAGNPEARHDTFRARAADIRAINREGAALLLQEGRPTAMGEGLFAEIRRWDDHYARCGDD